MLNECQGSPSKLIADQNMGWGLVCKAVFETSWMTLGKNLSPIDFNQSKSSQTIR